MLKSILEIKGVQELKKEVKENISGGFNYSSICPSEGDYCAVNGQPYFGVPCLAGPVNLYCINHTWQVCQECDMNQF
ncbi:hypothetical protein [Aquimarina sp. 2201CG5-10]|uniref:hypothetical protein n=1 Tax=Aquimarina callyspongiae TaxID=3098150 RepID=UPI002AB3DF83|nr:hypothetical protein [Aquimarina sp. 2201CG5-10]MDY8136989.1 hypothetical protein [Aquimarina sp. 2201CG5-10]